MADCGTCHGLENPRVHVGRARSHQRASRWAVRAGVVSRVGLSVSLAGG